MKVSLNEDDCSGCGVCEEAVPEVFAMNDAGTVDIKLTPIPDNMRAAVEDAADSCPSAAIVIED